MKNNKAFKSIMEGLSESLEYTKGNTTKARKMRLIDADKLKERINGDDVDEPLTIYGVEYYIDKAPTVDLWHYPSKGELPTNGEEVLCKLPYNYAVGKYNTYFEYFDFENTRYTPVNIECWQYIIPPEEIINETDRC